MRKAVRRLTALAGDHYQGLRAGVFRLWGSVLQRVGFTTELLPLVIMNLRGRVAHLNTVVDWLWQEWGTEKLTREHISQYVMSSVRSGQLFPSTYIAFLGNIPVGSVSIVRCDLPIRSQLTPWIASVVVARDQRGKGIGTRLLSYAERKLRAHGWPRVYLYTRDKEEYYLAKGYAVIERTTYLDHAISIMMKDLFPDA
ncbi:MAG: GNAT family N-acetyltransferase [Kiritimatiellia bacterium]